MGQFRDLTGQRFGRLVAKSAFRKAYCGRSAVFWECACDCGHNKPVLGVSLTRGLTQSCGCLCVERTKERGRAMTEAGLCITKDPAYGCWRSMNDRCYYTSHKHYLRYGGAGVSVFEEWRTSFEAFREYVGPRPSPQHSIDRFPCQSGNYEPGNVRWATPQEQQRNRSCNRMIDFQGLINPLAYWAEYLGIKPNTLRARLDKGWSVEKAFITPVREAASGK